MTSPISGADRVRRCNKRKRDAGLKDPHIWVHPLETAKVRAYAKKLPKTKAIFKLLGL